MTDQPHDQLTEVHSNPLPVPPLYNYATERLLMAAEASLAAWLGEEASVQEEHAETIEELRDALNYFAHHGHQPID